MGKVRNKVMRVNRGERYTFAVVLAVVITFSVYLTVHALNRTGVYDFASATGWSFTGGASALTGSLDSANGNLSPSYKGTTGTVRNTNYTGILSRQFTVPGSGTVNVKFMFDGMADAANNSNTASIDIYDSTNTNLVQAGVTTLSFSAPYTAGTWSTSAWSSDISLTGGTTYTVRINMQDRCLSNGTAYNMWIDNVFINAAPSGLSSTGATQNSVSLSWTGSTTVSGPSLSGYNVYYSTTSGSGYVKHNSSVVVGTTYTVTGLSASTPYYFVITDVDSAGVESPYSAEISSATTAPPDTTAPSIGVVTPSNVATSTYVDGTFDLSATVTEANTVTSCEYTTNGTTWLTGTVGGSAPNWTCTKAGITAADGAALTLNIRATDNSSNVGTGTPVSRTVDATAPAYSWNSPTAGTIYRNGSTISVDATITETGSGVTNGAACNALIDGALTGFSGTATYSSGTGKCTGTLNLTSGLADGAHNLTLQVADNVGNSAVSAARSITLDNTAPTVSSTVPAAGATGVALNGNVTINWSENVDCSTVNTTTITSTSPGWTYSSCSNNQAVFTTSGQANSTLYNVTVGTGVTDAAGNPMSAAYPFSYTTLAAAGVNGTTAGTATAVQASSTSISVTMPYTDDINGNNTYLVEYQQGAGPFIVWPPNPQGHTASPFTTTITGLTAGQTYTVRVTYQDAEGIVGGTAVQTLAPVTLVSWTDSNLVHNSNRFPGTTKWGGSWGIPGGQYGAFDCKTCHIAGSSNIKRVRTSVTAPSGSFPGGAVVFNSMTSFGNDTGGHTASLHICEACHSQNKYHNFDSTNNTGGLAHENNSDCTTCHPHNAGFRAGCDVCHGNPPTTADNDGSTNTGLAWKPAATGATSPGAHNMHAIARGMKCVTCHNGNTMPTVSNTIQMGFAMDKTNIPGFTGTKTGGSYDGFVPAAPYSFVTGDGGTTTVTQAGSNSCSNLYCHGGWTGSNGSITNPSWTGGATQAACGTCHGTTAATAPTAGSHGRHAANGAGQLALLCSSCHGTDPANNNHVNGRIYWNLATGDNRFGAGATYKTFANSSTAALAPYGGCTVYCHSSVQNATGSAVAAPTTSAVWGTAAPLSCDTSNCHGNPPAGGKHSIHAAYSYACATCHSGAGNETAKHADYKIDVAFSGLGAGGSYTQSAVNPPGNGFGSCSTIYCHSSGQSADGLSATPVYAGTNPAWGGTAACGSCHATTTMTTGSHTQHLALDTNCGNCHTGASAAAYSDAAHVNQLIDVAGSYTLGGAPGNGYGTCSTATCHGVKSPVWGANTTNATCTKCHGKPTTVANYSTARAWQAAPGYGTTGKDVAGQTGTFTNGVSNDPQVGAHDAHLRTINGYSDRQVLCTDCHAIPASGTHANGATDYSWSNLSKNIGTTGSVSSRGTLTPTYSAGTCSTNYCHGGKLAGGSDTTPGWAETGYLTAYAKNATNCGKCHGAPPTAAPSTFAHTGIAITDDCAGCHNHNGSGPTHIDGTLYGAGNCDSCHDYDTVGATYAAGRWTGGTWGKNYLDGTVHEGWGAHAKHINYIKTRLSIATALDPANQTYGLAGTNPEKVCGTCHSNDTGNHSMGGGMVRSINFGDGTFKMGGAAAGTSLLFGTTFPAQNPLYNGVSGTLSSTTAKTCSNLSCHYFTTPSW